MKFIKTVDGGYVNANLVKYFFTCAEDVNEYAVYARFKEWDYILIKFEGEAEAQAYLDKLVDNLNHDGQLKSNQPLEDKIAYAKILLDSAYETARALGNDALRNETLYYLDNALNAVGELLTFIK